MDESDLRARAAECRAYAATCGNSVLAEVAMDVALALEDAADHIAADATHRPRRLN
jgi:hypothetical protein